MTLDRSSIEALEVPSLTENIEFEVYNNSQIDEVAMLMFKGNVGHIDQIVFPNFFGTVEQCKDLINNIEKDVYGGYKEAYSWLLRENRKIIGTCFLTIIRDGAVGYIPDIVIDPNYQGKGLGKTILIHSMKELLSNESDIVSIDLDVTLENNAKFLYKSLGFRTVREYSMYTWLNQENV
jgi:ribosomal protein S18 acetylase RimI-like enzyme